MMRSFYLVLISFFLLSFSINRDENMILNTYLGKEINLPKKSIEDTDLIFEDTDMIIVPHHLYAFKHEIEDNGTKFTLGVLKGKVVYISTMDTNFVVSNFKVGSKVKDILTDNNLEYQYEKCVGYFIKLKSRWCLYINTYDSGDWCNKNSYRIPNGEDTIFSIFSYIN